MKIDKNLKDGYNFSEHKNTNYEIRKQEDQEFLKILDDLYKRYNKIKAFE